jgi:hypothetical protein
MRLIVSVLFIVIIVLAIAINRFYSYTDDISGNGKVQPAIAKKLGTDTAGNRIFLDSNGHYGILNPNEHLIVSPEWNTITFTDGELCIASKRLKNKNLFGCIDYEGNVKVPFVYENIERLNISDQTLYLAKISGEKKCVIYDADFAPCFSRSWDDCSLDHNNQLVLTSGSAVYKYVVTANELIFKDALIKGTTLDRSYEFEITSRVLLSELSPSAIERMDRAVSRYIEYAFTGNSDVLSEVRSTPSALFLTLFPEEHSITSKRLTNITEISAYSIRSDDGLAHYAVSVAADIAVSYTAPDGKKKRLRGNHKAVIEFKGVSENDLRVVSARFNDDKPDYPANDPEPQNTSANPANAAANHLTAAIVGKDH